jgi:hypothetical protein
VAEVTYYMVQPFVAIEGGDLGWASVVECFNAGAAGTVAGALARTKDYVGAIAYSATHDPQTSKREVRVLATFGDVPDDLSAFVTPVLKVDDPSRPSLC